MLTRRILHHGPTPVGTPVLLSDRAIGGCWFELHRQGGCGAGELVLQREFQERGAIQIGDWISCEGVVGERWYLGRVEECRYQHPGLVRLRLAGMAIELNEVFPGGFDASPPERRPHRYGDTDLFSNDPDRLWEVAHPAPTIESLVRLLLQHHVQNKTHISYVPTLIESSLVPVKPLTAKFRGEESLRSILKDLSLRAQASWGVDAFGRFFFIRRRTSLQSTFRLGRDLVSLEETRDREMIFNRLLLTGDYIYDHRDNSGQIARRVFRWRANYFEPSSCQLFGNRRLRLWVPWIRTQSDSVDFAREFFRLYARPAARYSVDTLPQDTLLIPWEGPVTIEDASGNPLATGIVEKVRVLFDHAPRFRLQVGPEDPREQWPEPPQDERWQLPDHIPSNGGNVSVTNSGGSGGGGGGGGGSSVADPKKSSSLSDNSSDLSSDQSSSDDSSEGSSDSSVPSNPSTGATGHSYSGHGNSSGSEVTSDNTSAGESSPASESLSESSSDLTAADSISFSGMTSSSAGASSAPPSSSAGMTSTDSSLLSTSSATNSGSSLRTGSSTPSHSWPSSGHTNPTSSAAPPTSSGMTSGSGGNTSQASTGGSSSGGRLTSSHHHPSTSLTYHGPTSSGRSSNWPTSTGGSSFWTHSNWPSSTNNSHSSWMFPSHSYHYPPPPPPPPPPSPPHPSSYFYPPPPTPPPPSPPSPSSYR